MINKLDICGAIGVVCSDELMGIAKGTTSLPLYDCDVPPYWYNSPPAFLPLWERYSGITTGVWIHDVYGPSFSYVQFHRELAAVSEIARTDEQLLSDVVISALVEQDKEVASDEIRRFSALVDIHSLDELDAFTCEYGDDSSEFYHLKLFSDKLPAACLSDPLSYDGHVAPPKDNYPIEELQRYSSFELSFESQSKINEEHRSTLPTRLVTNGERKQQFEAECRAGKLQEAWLTLNSTGWKREEALIALKKLTMLSPTPLLNEIVAAWSSYRGQGQDNY